MRSWTSLARVSVLLAPVVLLACGDDLGPRVPAAIVIVPNEPRIPTGTSRQLTATVVDAGGRAIDGLAVAFESSEPAIITVDGTGLVTAVGPLGFASVTASAGELTAHVDVEVILAPSVVIVSPASLTMQDGDFVQLTVAVTDENSQVLFNPPLVFTSGDTDVATVDEFGFVSGIAAGTTTITVASGELTGTVPVAVNQIPTSIVISPTQVVVPPGGSQQFTATVLSQSGAEIAGAAISWTSDAQSVAIVSPTGLVTAVAATGVASISAHSDALVASATVFVGTPPAGTVLATVPTANPWGVTVTESGRYLVATTDGRLESGTLPDFGFPITVNLNAQATDVVVNQAGTLAYVAGANDGSGPGGIGVVNLASNALVDVIPVPGTTFAVALSEDESRLIVGTDGGYVVVNISNGNTVGGLATGLVNTITRHPTEPLLYATVAGSQVLELDAQTGEVVRTFSASGGLQGNAVSPDGSLLYVASESAEQVHIFDLASGAELPGITTSGGFGLAISPDGEFVYLTMFSELRIVDRETGTLVRTVTLGGWARRIAFSDDGIAVVTNQDGWVDFVR